jgi:hypothetical protein
LCAREEEGGAAVEVVAAGAGRREVRERHIESACATGAHILKPSFKKIALVRGPFKSYFEEIAECAVCDA